MRRLLAARPARRRISFVTVRVLRVRSARPRNYALYEHADLALQAAALAHGIAEGQTFVDGNKRLALIAMLAFLEINGFEVEAADPGLAAWILSLGSGTTPEELAKLIRARLRPISPRSSTG
jgi:death-on-curing protein